MRKIAYQTFLDKVHGCWYGKCLGGAAGAPVEGIKSIIEVRDFTEIFNPDLPNDDLDIQLLWLDVLERKGTNIDSCDLADAWVEKCWYPFSEYGYFLKNYMRGIKPPYSGMINNEFFKEGMGCPIRSEIWGIISVGNPELAAKYAYMDATLDHAGNSVYAEQFLAVIESMAFFEADPEKLIQIGLSFVPEESKLYQCVNEVLHMYRKNDWKYVRAEILRKYSHPDFTNVVQNLGFIVLALLGGNGDMRKTINIALQCGYDTDCTCASAASIVGIMKGYQGLSEELKSLINDYFVIGIDVVRPSDSIRQLAKDSAAIALKTPNHKVMIEGMHCERPQDKMQIVIASEEGYKEALYSTRPVVWEMYGPYFEAYKMPLAEKNPVFMRPDMVFVVNNQVEFDKCYWKESDKPVCTIESYEDLIEVEKYVSMQGQMCVYLKTELTVEEDKDVWLLIGNTDGFKIWCNGQEILSRDEIRLYTPYNNFTMLHLKKGKNQLMLKLLRRTEQMKFAIGFRNYDGCHWHWSKWCTDLMQGERK